MKIAAIIAEYNPFHNGHAYHLQKTREAGADAVVAVMSGNFVQRGEPAAFSKWARAEAAVRCGVDLVLELPVFWAVSGAQRFARGGVRVIQHTGVVNLLSFGSECGDVQRIVSTVDILENLTIPDSLLRSGMAFASARESAVHSIDASAAALLKAPNDTLAVEYALAAKMCGASLDLLAVPRLGSHDSASTDGFASASFIRSHLSEQMISEHCPAPCAKVLMRELSENRAPAELRLMERALLAKLRTTPPETIARLPDVSEGLENRIHTMAQRAQSIEELAALVKSKRYAHARIRRILLSALLDLYEDDIPQDIPYLRILAIGRRGEDVLRRMKQKADLPMLSRMTDVHRFGESAVKTFEAEMRASEIYSILLPKCQPGGAELTVKIPVFTGSGEGEGEKYAHCNL